LICCSFRHAFWLKEVGVLEKTRNIHNELQTTGQKQMGQSCGHMARTRRPLLLTLERLRENYLGMHSFLFSYCKEKNE
jgi:hypothetical protein